MFDKCNLEYLDLAENKINVATIKSSSLKESNCFENKVDSISFDENNLTLATFYNTPVKGLDISTCIIDGIRMDKKSLEGISINRQQVGTFCHLLGLKVID